MSRKDDFMKQGLEHLVETFKGDLYDKKGNKLPTYNETIEKFKGSLEKGYHNKVPQVYRNDSTPYLAKGARLGALASYVVGGIEAAGVVGAAIAGTTATIGSGMFVPALIGVGLSYLADGLDYGGKRIRGELSGEEKGLIGKVYSGAKSLGNRALSAVTGGMYGPIDVFFSDKKYEGDVKKKFQGSLTDAIEYAKTDFISNNRFRVIDGRKMTKPAINPQYDDKVIAPNFKPSEYVAKSA